MVWDEPRLTRVLADLARRAESRGILLPGGLRWRLCSEVATAAVSLGDAPEARVNPEFLEAWCVDEGDAQVVLLHEWVHVLFGHASRRDAVDPLWNLALDTLVNRVVARVLPGTADRFLHRLYEGERGGYRLLRPMAESDRAGRDDEWGDPGFHGIWEALDAGRISSHDVHDYLESARFGTLGPSGIPIAVGVG
ncbi:MAG: DUF2201 family putative metallopeptidase [Armatimonadota bacterium]